MAEYFRYDRVRPGLKPLLSRLRKDTFEQVFRKRDTFRAVSTGFDEKSPKTVHLFQHPKSVFSFSKHRKERFLENFL